MLPEKQSTTASSLDVFAEVIEKHGRAVMQKAVDQTLNSKYDAGTVSLAMKHHARFLSNVLPVFPALITLSCESVGGKMEKFVGIGAALTLFVEAANIHDDLIDQTLVKHKRKTTFGKFGADVTLLAGDVLLVQAALSLSRECELLTIEQKEQVLELTFQALIKICKSASNESAMRRRIDVSPKDYLEVVRLRAAVPEAHCMIGGILGCGSKSMISSLGNYGRNYGIVGTIIDEFMDLFDYQKFSSRLKNECVPFPLLCAITDSKAKEKIMPFLNDFSINKNDYDSVVKLVADSDEVNKLRNNTLDLLTKSNIEIEKNLKESTARRDLTALLAVLERLLCNVDEFTNRLL